MSVEEADSPGESLLGSEPAYYNMCERSPRPEIFDD